MKRTLPLIVLASATLLFGAGCAKSAMPSSADQYSTPAPQAQAPSPSPTDQNSQSPNPTPAVKNSSLAFPGILPDAEVKTHVRMKTSKGDIVLEMLPDQGPKAASNFVYLVKQKFYDGIIFHRREEGFVIQGGDPDGVGTGGPGYQFGDDPVKPLGQNPQTKELPADLKDRMPPGSVLYARGTLAMANAGANTNGSQFFIMLGDAPLPPAYSIFGRVTQGLDVVDKIAIGDKMISVTVE